MSVSAFASGPGAVVPMAGMAEDMKRAMAQRAARQYFHVVGLPHVHPNNMWTRREDGLYEMAGSAYAFDDAQVRVCTTRDRWGSCACPVREGD